MVQQHLDEAVFLHSARSGLLDAPHVRLRKLQDFDDRLAANLDGLSMAGDYARKLCQVALESARPAVLFVATSQALGTRDAGWLEHLLALAEDSPASRARLIAAFGWTDRRQLQGVVAELLQSPRPLARLVAMAACGQHRVDPGIGPQRLLDDATVEVRARACRTAGELGRREFVSRLGAMTDDEDERCRFWAAWAAVLLGDRLDALERLQHFAMTPGPFRLRALQLALQALSPAGARAFVQDLSEQAAPPRQLIRAAGLSGDPAWVPWLIECMHEDRLGRIAGEAFSLITGVDSEWLDLERTRPKTFESGPNDDPHDADVAMDEDEGLPWPAPAKVQQWWQTNASRFAGQGRYFMGQPLNRNHCMRILKEGLQRQRIAAALHLPLLDPGTVLFEWRAPARRQRRLLAEMT